MIARPKRKLALASSMMLLALCVVCASAKAQQARKVPRIGLLALFSAANRAQKDAFRQGLSDLGYSEGKNIVIEYRYAEGNLNRLTELASELVRLKVDVIVTAGSNPARAAQKATGTIPIVMTNAADPVADGLVASLARPGANITGLSRMAPDLSSKRLELLRETVPSGTRLAVLWNPTPVPVQPRSNEVESAARKLGMTVQSLKVQTPEEFEGVFRAVKKEKADVLFAIESGFMNSQRKLIVELAAKNRLPAMYEAVEFVEDGGLMSYGPSNADSYRRAAYYVDKILKGAKPGDLPVEQPTKFELV
ncbi:MAG TPA: ABC transporter substrate-binding protein, partial [Verrucomicrobiae bacterium]|nr:ABC transporter substrate-binding protein [Verrucomicrobiae bacterium]